MVPSPQILQSHNTFGKGEACAVTGTQTLVKDCCQGAVNGRMEPFAGTMRATASAPELTLGRGLEWVHQSEKLQPKAKDVSILLSEVTKGCPTHRAEGLLASHPCLPHGPWLRFYLRESFKAHFGFW